MSTAKVQLRSTRLAVPDDPEAVYAYFEEQGWGDGHPIIPPTEQRVARFLEQVGRDPQEALGVLEPSHGVLTVEKLAVCAVMAGCRPRDMDILLPVVKVLGNELRGGLGNVLTTAHSLSPFILVNGPIARELEITSGADGATVSWRANASIARAVRFVLLNIAGIRGVTDGNTFGWLVKYSYCMAENEADNPWEPYHVEKGFARDDSTVAFFLKEPAHHIEIAWPASAQELLQAFCDSMCTVASRSSYGDGFPVLALCPEQAKTVAAAGFSKEDVKHFVFEHARIPLWRYGPNAVQGFNSQWKKLYSHSPNVMVPMIASPAGMDVIVIGGPGPNSLYLPFGGKPIIKRIVKQR